MNHTPLFFASILLLSISLNASKNPRKGNLAHRRIQQNANKERAASHSTLLGIISCTCHYSTDAATVKELKARGFVTKDIQEAHEVGNFPLHAAVVKQKPQTAQWLIEHKANVNQENWLRMPPLQLAIIKKDPNMVRMLLEAKASVSANDSFSDSIESAYEDGERYGQEVVNLIQQFKEIQQIKNEEKKQTK